MKLFSSLSKFRFSRFVDLNSLVDTTKEGRCSLEEVEKGVGHILRDAISHDVEVSKQFVNAAEDIIKRYSLV